MPPLTIRIKKNADGTGALTCVRANGTVTWQRQREGHAQFFALHDLTHYAVETVLGHRRGFYGLVSEGWDFDDFGAPWPRDRIPADAEPSELIVGLLDAERACGAEWTAAEFREQAAQTYALVGVEGAQLTLTDDDLARIRERRRELFARWDAVAPGDSLELTFDPAAPAG